VLASLAYDGRRRELFETEFLAALKLIDTGFTRAHLRGSYAGATGLPQFMPSLVLRLRADGDGDGQADIWSSEPDALASIAYYLRESGWKPGVPWGIEVRVPATFNRAAVSPTEVAPRCPAVFRRHSRPLPFSQWRALGISPAGKAMPDTEMAWLMELDGPGGPAYLLTANYRAILQYNCSNSYAMSIGLLADAISRR
jgi:membrane-bound lytic murein transglycosylase B